MDRKMERQVTPQYEHQGTLQPPGDVQPLGDGWEYHGGCILDGEHGPVELVRWRRRRR